VLSVVLTCVRIESKGGGSVPGGNSSAFSVTPFVDGGGGGVVGCTACGGELGGASCVSLISCGRDAIELGSVCSVDFGGVEGGVRWMVATRIVGMTKSL